MEYKLHEGTVELSIFGQPWQVSVLSSNSPDLLVDGSFRRGACWVGHHKIALSMDLTDRTAPEVIGHEIAHAILASTQVTQPDNYDEEALCEFAAFYASYIVATTDYLLKSLLKKEVGAEQ